MKLFFRKNKASKPRHPAPEWHARCPDFSPKTRATIDAVTPFTMTSPERIAALCDAVDYVCQHEVPGDIVECGVWRGGSMMAVAKTLLSHQQTQRRLWLYDTFEGMPPPTGKDVDFCGRRADGLLASSDRDDPNSVWCYSALDHVKQNMRHTEYPESHMEFVAGPIEHTIPSRMPKSISLLRLDTDWYESTKHELQYLFPRLSIGGVIVIDDYGHWKGCRKAVDEYFSTHNIPILLSRIDYTGRLGIKLSEPSSNDNFAFNCKAA